MAYGDSLANPAPGASFAAEYQVAGLPHVETLTAPTFPLFTRIDFQKVAKSMTIRNNGGNDLRIAFTENGLSGTNYYLIPSGSESDKFDIRTKVVYFSGDGGDTDLSLMAELTTIDARHFPILTGSQVVESDPGSGWNGVG
jgi:hypothetical protein